MDINASFSNASATAASSGNDSNRFLYAGLFQAHSVTDFKKKLESALHDITWNFVGILDTKKELHPIPKNIQVQALFEYLALERVRPLAQKLGCEIHEAENTRQYPDITVEGGPFGNRKIAIDVKTTRRLDANTVSGFTLGSYAGYFRKPAKKLPGCRFPYGEFNEHWIIGFIYTWNEDADTLHMITDLELIVQPKWKLASKSTGTGTTTAIRSVTNMERLRRGEGDFESERSFLQFWRSYKTRRAMSQ
jgi:hypothetical protein